MAETDFARALREAAETHGAAQIDMQSLLFQQGRDIARAYVDMMKSYARLTARSGNYRPVGGGDIRLRFAVEFKSRKQAVDGALSRQCQRDSVRRYTDTHQEFFFACRTPDNGGSGVILLRQRNGRVGKIPVRSVHPSSVRRDGRTDRLGG